MNNIALFLTRRRPKAHRPKSLLRLTTHLSLLTLFFVLPVFSQQRWERNYGGYTYDRGNSVQQTSDMGYIVTGYALYGYTYKVYLIKTNAFGDALWTRTYGGAGSDDGYSVQQTSDAGYIVAGNTSSFGNSNQVYLVKTDSLGDTLWTKTYGGSNADLGYSVLQTSDGGYIVAGWTDSFGTRQVYLIKTNASGDSIWTRTYGDTAMEEGYSVQQTSDGGYIVAGTTTSFGNGAQVYLVKTNASGDTLWTKNFGGANNDEGHSVQQTSDTGYIVAGWSSSFGNSVQVYLIKTNAQGDTLWTRTYGGDRGEWGYSVQQTSDGGYIVAGVTYWSPYRYQVYLIKTNAQGDSLWSNTYGGGDYDDSRFVRQTTDGGYIVTGCTYSFGNDGQVYLIKTDAYGSSGVESSPSPQLPVTSFSAFPNPFTSFASVPGHASEHFALYDISGRKVGVYPGARVGEGLSAGVYFLKSEGKYAKPLKIVKLR